jgi:hypothetical protein
MNHPVTHDPLRAASELREQLASDKRRMAFFFGAGTSMAVGVPGIIDLTAKVEEHLPKDRKSEFIKVKATIKGLPNVEDVLNRLRLYRALLDTGTGQPVDGLTADSAKMLDVVICGAISKIVRSDPPKGLKPHLTFAQWLHALHMTRDCPVEVFTTNYDLLLERAMEEAGLPFFDGFVGSVAPFFVPESVEADIGQPVAPPKCWTRLWKMHGSVGWHLRQGSGAGKSRIARLTDCPPDTSEELIIFPSREKYVASRKLPFLAYQDRLRKFLSAGESVLFVVGYGFSDEHINEIVFQGLRSNSRLAVAVFVYGDEAKADNTTKLVLPEAFIAYGLAHRNLSIYGPDKAVVGGMVGDWSEPSRKKREGEVWPFWADAQRRFTLGDFNAFAEYLESYIGFRPAVPPAETGLPQTGAQSQEPAP